MSSALRNKITRNYISERVMKFCSFRLSQAKGIVEPIHLVMQVTDDLVHLLATVFVGGVICQVCDLADRQECLRYTRGCEAGELGGLALDRRALPVFQTLDVRHVNLLIGAEAGCFRCPNEGYNADTQRLVLFNFAHNPKYFTLPK